jgi:hypothetical protein
LFFSFSHKVTGGLSWSDLSAEYPLIRFFVDFDSVKPEVLAFASALSIRDESGETIFCLYACDFMADIAFPEIVFSWLRSIVVLV